MAGRRSTTAGRRGRVTAPRRRPRPLLSSASRRRRREAADRAAGAGSRLRPHRPRGGCVRRSALRADPRSRFDAVWPRSLRLASWGTIEQKVSGRAYVVREETIVTAAAAGTVRPRVAEGERVRPGQTLVELVDLAASREIEAQLVNLDRQIVAAQEAAQGAQAADPQAAARALEAYRRSADRDGPGSNHRPDFGLRRRVVESDGGGTRTGPGRGSRRRPRGDAARPGQAAIRFAQHLAGP
ncbi:MAG: hypothetical protein MZU79_00765 [Anaerotruncus sp.]|nr:hypothetical protein [Anaerotruncus sp.]